MQVVIVLMIVIISEVNNLCRSNFWSTDLDPSMVNCTMWATSTALRLSAPAELPVRNATNKALSVRFTIGKH